MKSPLRYPGGKTKLAPWIASLLPQTPRYLEPYFGSGAVFFARDPADYEVINDLDDRVVTLFRVIRDHGDELAELIAATPYARSEYRQTFRLSGLSDLELARRFLVRAWMTYGYNLYQPSAGWRRGKARSWCGVPDRIVAAISRLRQAEIECRPALEVIAAHRRPDTLIYADPSYLHSTRRLSTLYRHEMTEADHVALLDALNAHPGVAAISGYRSPLYDEHLAHWTRYDRRHVVEQAQRRVECLWINRTARLF